MSLVERLRDQGHLTQRDGLAALTATATEAATELERLTAENREQAMQILATEGQAMELQAENARLRGLIRWEAAQGQTLAEMRDNLTPELRNIGDCKLVWVNEGDLATAALNALDPET
jgi:hypothetical protein